LLTGRRRSSSARCGQWCTYGDGDSDRGDDGDGDGDLIMRRGQKQGQEQSKNRVRTTQELGKKRVRRGSG
jgi:hypothetical protein